MSNKIYYSFEKVTRLVTSLEKQIIESGINFTDIHGIKRGGLIPAVMLSHRLDIPYSNKINANTLVVDDICDSGETLNNLTAIHTAVLSYKPHTSIFKPNFYGEEFTKDDWINYPWERSDSRPVQGYLENHEKYIILTSNKK
jgi:hypoxanthine phosphoribosyltransferase